MKKLFIILLSVLSLTAFAQQKKVAVYVTGEQSGISKVLGDQLVAAFAKSGRYSAIERTSSFLAELNKEQSYQRSGAVNDNQIARLGEQFGVNYVCVADMTDAFGEKYISARLINVETAEVVNTHNVSGEMNSMSACIQMASEIAAYLSKGTFAEQKAEEEERNQVWVDLGLPSGTLWKSKDESGYYSHKAAINLYENDLPTKKQYEELIKYCERIWIDNDCKFVGPNGKSIIMYTKGTRHSDGVFLRRMAGFYWSSTPVDSERAWFLNIRKVGDWCVLGDDWVGNENLVRLVKNK